MQGCCSHFASPFCGFNTLGLMQQSRRATSGKRVVAHPLITSNMLLMTVSCAAGTSMTTWEMQDGALFQ